MFILFFIVTDLIWRKFIRNTQKYYILDLIIVFFHLVGFLMFLKLYQKYITTREMLDNNYVLAKPYLLGFGASFKILQCILFVQNWKIKTFTCTSILVI